MTLNQLLALTSGLALIPTIAVWRGRYVVPATLVASTVILVLHGYVFWDHTVDDAYISFRYAKNFANGDGLVWNEGERVEGYSNFLWVILLAGTERLGLGIVEPSRWIGFMATVGLLVTVYLLARELAANAADGSAIFALSALMLVASAPISFWTFAGLEQPLFVFLVTLCLWLHSRENAGRLDVPLSALVAFLAAITRPEGVLLAVGLVALKGWAALRARPRRRAEALRLTRWLAIFGLPYAAFLAFRFTYYGDLLPNTYYQKLDGQSSLSWARYDAGLEYGRRFWEQYGYLLVFPLPFAALFVRQARSTAIPLLLFAVAWAAYVTYTGSDFLQFFRFLVPLLPVLYVLSATALFSGANRIRERLSGRLRQVPSANLTRALVMLLMLPVILTLMHVPKPLINEARFWEEIGEQRLEIAEWLREQDPDVVIAVNAAGQIPYWSEVSAIDTLGLTDEHIAHREPYVFEPRVPGHMKGDARYILDRRPDIIIVTAGLYLLPLSKEEWQARTVALPADLELLRQPDLWDLYDPAWVKTSSGNVFNFLLLKGTSRVEAFISPEKRVQY